MSQQNILELAKQGDINAIAALINKSLNAKGITAKAGSKGDCLRIVLESTKVPDQASMARFIYNGVLKLGVSNFSTLQILGRQLGSKSPAWSKTVTLQHLQTTPVTEHQQRPRLPQRSRNEKVFTVKHDEQEFIAYNTAELRQWLAEGKIRFSDYVHNPILEKWMYVRELAEIEDVVRQEESSTQANQYNQMSFVFAGLGLLMLFIFPLAGIVLLVIGIVFSAMYYTRKGATDRREVVPKYTNHITSLPANPPKSRIETAVLAILLGGLGIHFFYLEAWGWGIISILLCWTYIPAIAGLILGIRYLTMSDQEFEHKAKKLKGAFGAIEL